MGHAPGAVQRASDAHENLASRQDERDERYHADGALAASGLGEGADNEVRGPGKGVPYGGDELLLEVRALQQGSEDCGQAE